MTDGSKHRIDISTVTCLDETQMFQLDEETKMICTRNTMHPMNRQNFIY